MRTNIEIDDDLMTEVLERSGLATKREAVNRALEIYVQRLRQREILKSRGAFQWTGDLGSMRADKPDSPWFS
jgi:Arc/MetJ family transcription regulator